MQKTYIIIALSVFAFFTAANLSAQSAYYGGITATDVKQTRSGDSLRLTMNLDVKDFAVNKHQSMSVIPVLSNGDDRIEYPYIMVNGKNMNQMYKRKVSFKNTALMQNMPQSVMVVDKKHKGGKIAYTGAVKHEPWMDKAALNLRFGLGSYANENEYYTAAVSMAQPSAPKHPAPVQVIVPVVAPTPPPAPVQAVVPVVVPTPPPTPPTQTVVPIIVPVPAPEPEPTPTHVVVVTKGRHTFSGDAFLDFETGLSALQTDYKRNPDELARIKEVMTQITNNPGTTINSLTITGYASPDGNYAANGQLAQARAQSLATYLQTTYGMNPSEFKVGAVAEDWTLLRNMVVESNIPYKTQVLALIDGRDAPDVKESKLRGMMGGQIWRIMSSTMFPRLRRVVYNIDYVVAE